MKRKKERSRATHVAGDSRKRRLHQLFKVCAVLLLPTLYLFYSLSGLYLVDVEISKLKEQIIWCLLHPLKVYNDKSYSMVLVGGLLWMICSFQAYSKSDHNRMPGNEFGSAKWGEVRAFNEKYAARTEETKSGLSPENKVLSQNVRFRYDSDTLRNNNIVVVGGSGAGKTAFFLTPNLTRKNGSAATLDRKIYVLGGENASGSLNTFAVYDTERKTWESLPAYPGTESGICKAAMFAYNNEIYVIGGQTDTGVTAKLLKSVYAYNIETRQWQKKADLAEGRTNLATALSKDKVYTWTKAGTTDKAEIYDIKTDIWETAVLPDTSAVIAAASVDNRVFVLKEDGEKMFWQEYLPEDNLFEDVGTVCPFAASDIYGTPVVISGKIYMAKTEETKEVLVYDAYSDEWSRISDMNLTKKDSMLAASGNDIYSIGGELAGFGVLDTVEQYTVKVQTTTKQMAVNQGESYELQVNAGNLKKGQAKIVTVNVNPEEMKIQNASSFETEDTLKEGADGVTLLKYQPKKGVIVLKLTGSLERGESYETYQSIPVEAKITGKTTVEITLTEGK